MTKRLSASEFVQPQGRRRAIDLAGSNGRLANAEAAFYFRSIPSESIAFKRLLLLMGFAIP
jgi:hypothetical protein